MNIADLHIHTTASDGSYSPGDVLRLALRMKMQLLAVADHEETKGSRALLPLCKEAGMPAIAACELSAMRHGVYLHILGYGVDFDEPTLSEIVRYNRFVLDRMSDQLIRVLEKEDARISFSEYLAYQRDERRGGWKGIDYLFAKGILASPKAGIPLYDARGITYERAGFPDFSDVARAIHAAGGRCVIAHPGIIKTQQPLSLVEELFSEGLDGAECYYPKHDVPFTEALVSLCAAHGKNITCGSDCHGAFGSARIGETNTDISQLNLNGIRIHGGIGHAF